MLTGGSYILADWGDWGKRKGAGGREQGEIPITYYQTPTI
ncbi:hypothetical protein FDUTEX481_03280 [Tolypothrix sp. PCC 7601]|nr:hypothetical protein FDUTEX481_03280 [Tolypothrix sp. PCC 7601]